MEIGKLIVFSAPSGSGKTTLVKHLLKQNLSLGFSISATSRKPRGEEEDGIAYYFLSKEAFRQKIHEDAFVEYEEVYKDNFYGTLKTEVQRLCEEGKNILFDIDVQGGLKIKSKYPENTLAVFVQPPSLEELEKRLLERSTESKEKIQKRLYKAEVEMTFSEKFDAILVNDDLTQAKKDVVRLVNKFLNS